MTALPHVIAADPPWSFGDKLPGKTRGAERNYKVMTVADLCDLKPKAHADSLLFLWRVASMPEEALQVVRAWGYVPKSEIVWVKTTAPVASGKAKLHFGMGRYVRMSHEVCIIAARGKAIPLIQSHSVRSVFYAEVREHSAKPEEFYALVEKLAVGPYLELFARRTRRGWIQEQSDELGKLDGSPGKKRRVA